MYLFCSLSLISPGVSTKTICAVPSVNIAWDLVLVVCTFPEVAQTYKGNYTFKYKHIKQKITFLSIKLLINVLFPALGKPIIATFSNLVSQFVCGKENSIFETDSQ